MPHHTRLTRKYTDNENMATAMVIPSARRHLARLSRRLSQPINTETTINPLNVTTSTIKISHLTLQDE